MVVQRFLFIIAIATFNLSYADTYTSGDCSPITENISGNLTVKCNSETEGEVIVSVDLKNQIIPDYISPNRYDLPVEYIKNKRNDKLDIIPILKPNTNTSEGISFPILDIKVSNNKTSNLTIDGVQLNILESKQYKSPYLTDLTFCSNNKIGIYNNGYTSVKNAKIIFNISPTRLIEKEGIENISFENLKHKKIIDIEKRAYLELDITNFLLKDGIDIRNITDNDRKLYSQYIENCSNEDREQTCTKEQKKLFKEMWENLSFGNLISKSLPRIKQIEEKKWTIGNRPYITVYGYYIYEYYDYFLNKIVVKKDKFITDDIDPLSTWGCGDYMPDTHRYSVKLKVRGSNYTIEKSLSQKIKPRDSDRFSIVIGAQDASFHEFGLSLHTLEHGYLPAQRIRVLIPNYSGWGNNF